MVYINPLHLCRDYAKGYKTARVSDVRRHFTDTDLASKLLGFRTEIDLREGLKNYCLVYKKIIR